MNIEKERPMETLFILREWLFGETEELRRFTLDELLTVQNTLGMESEEFSEFITGYNCDSYADKCCEVMSDLYNDLSHLDEDEYKLENAFIRSMKDEEFLTCYTVWRLWNSHLDKEEADKIWHDDCIATLEGILED